MMLSKVDFSSPNLRFNGEPVRIRADASNFSIEVTASNRRVIKECPTWQITKIKFAQSGGHYWFYFYFDDGEIVELRQLQGYSDTYPKLDHQLKLVLAEAKRLAKATGSRNALNQSVKNLLTADVITAEDAKMMRLKIEKLRN